MSGGTKTTSNQQSQQQSTSGSGQAWANPYAVEGVNQVFNTHTANQPNLDAQVAKANELSAKLSGNYDAMTAGYGNASGLGAKGAGYYSDVLGGNYLEGNPYLQAMIGATAGDVTDRVNSQFTSAGRYGSEAHTGVLAQQLAEAENALRYGDYNNQMGRMDMAAAGSLAEQQAAAQRQQAAAALAAAQQGQAAQLPYTGSTALAQALSALFGGGASSGTSTGTSVSKTQPDFLGALGSGLGTAAMAFSDPALKDEAVLIGRYPDGLGLWEYSYIGSDVREFGVMADEVADLRPWALGPAIGGFKTVNYEVL